MSTDDEDRIRPVRRPTRPGVVEVARAAGVAPSTVSNVYNRPHAVSAALRERVLNAATDLGYAGADPAGRNLREGRTNAIGIVMRERLAYSFEDAAAVQLMQGFSDAADPEQLAMVIVPANPETATSAGPAVSRVAVDGFLVYSLVGDDPLIDAVRRRALPTVVVDSPAPDSAAANEFDFVGIDEQQPSQAAMQHLLSLGHRRVAVLSTRLSAQDRPGLADLLSQAAATASVATGRLQGAAAAVAAAGLSWAAVPVVQCPISSIEQGRIGAHALLAGAPATTAVFAFSDPLALGARIAARERGLAVPGQLSIIGFDDSAPTSEGLSTVHQPLRAKGRVATERLLAALRGNRPTEPLLLPTRLVVRGSTGPPLARGARTAQPV